LFFVLSKILDVALSPLLWGMVLVALGVRLSRRPPRIALRWRPWWLPLAGVGVLYVFAVDPVANRLVRSLESDAPRTYRPGVTYDAVVILGGLVDEPATVSSGVPSFNDNVERMLSAYDLLRRGFARSAIVSSGPLATAGPVEAHVVADELEAWGIEKDRIVIEDRARNTHENAVYVSKIARDRGWKDLVVVTSAFHMRRAMECFNAENLAVDALPVDYRSYDPDAYTGSLLPRAHSLAMSEMAIREEAGRVIYRLRGYGRTKPKE
jgi:uncharacterized SAM-binding protein YcdF (DUF218 family)